MHLHDQSQKISHFGKNVLYVNFIKSPQNYCLFHKSLAKIVHILEIINKEIVYIGLQPWKKGRGKTKVNLSIGFEISMNMPINNEIIAYFDNRPKKCIFY